MLAALIQIDAWDPATGAAVSLRAASHDHPGLCHLNAMAWLPAIETLPTLKYDLFDGSFASQITAPTGSLSLAVEAWPSFARYSLADARFWLWTAELGDPWASFTLRFDGRITAQPRLRDGIAQLLIAVDDRWLDTALLVTYAGTGGVEGPAALKGEVKPLALGAPRYIDGKLIDPINSVFQLNNGAINGVEAALERLARYGAAVADYASYATLVAAPIAPGTWATANAVGLVRFGAPPAGQISFLARGDSGGVQGWVRTPGQLIRRLALLSGGAGKINDISLDALDVSRPYNLSAYLREQTTARDLIQRLAASINAVAGVDFLGKLFVVPVAIGAPTLNLAADGSALPPVGSVEQLEVAAPFKSVAVEAERTWTVHQLADIAFTATLQDTGAWVGTTTYREGNIVQQGGASWLYINPAPTVGNAPPVLPVQSNSWWKALSPSIGDVVTAQATADSKSADFAGSLLGAAANGSLKGNKLTKNAGNGGFNLGAVAPSRSGAQVARMAMPAGSPAYAIMKFDTDATDYGTATGTYPVRTVHRASQRAAVAGVCRTAVGGVRGQLLCHCTIFEQGD